MKVSLTKRAAAWIIDIIVITIVLFLVSLIYTPDDRNLNTEMDKVTVDYANQDISFTSYITKTSNIYKEIDQKNILLNIVNTMIFIAYFIILPYFNDGKTIGKQLQKLKIKTTKSKLSSLFVRSLIVNGLLYLFTIIICTIIIPSNLYFASLTIFGIIQIILIIISAFIVTYRKDQKGLHDIIAKTSVITTK